MSSTILKKFIEPLKLIRVQQTDLGAVTEETETEFDFEGAIFDLAGKETKLILDGILKVNSKKLYTYKDIVDSKKHGTYHKVLHKGKEYTINIKKEFHSDPLKIYYLEVLE